MTRVLLDTGTCASCVCSFPITVAIPVFNAGATIEAQLESLASQDCHFPWLTVLADNGSTDDSLAAITRVAQRFHRLLVVDASDKRGAAHARNTAAALAASRDLAFLDADDVASGSWLGELAARLNQHAFVAGRLEQLRLNAADVLEWRELHQDLGLASFEGIDYVLSANLGIRRELFQRVGGFDESFPTAAFEDVDLAIRLRKLGEVPVFAQEAVVHYRHRGQFTDALKQARVYGAASWQIYERNSELLPQPSPLSGVQTIGHQLLAIVLPSLREGGSRRMMVWGLTYHVAQFLAAARRASFWRTGQRSRQASSRKGLT